MVEGGSWHVAGGGPTLVLGVPGEPQPMSRWDAACSGTVILHCFPTRMPNPVLAKYVNRGAAGSGSREAPSAGVRAGSGSETESSTLKYPAGGLSSPIVLQSSRLKVGATCEDVDGVVGATCEDVMGW